MNFFCTNFYVLIFGTKVLFTVFILLPLSDIIPASGSVFFVLGHFYVKVFHELSQKPLTLAFGPISEATRPPELQIQYSFLFHVTNPEPNS